MLTETEIKLRIRPQGSDRVPELPLFRDRLVGGWQRIELLNQYYDTPDLALDRAGFALRLRRDGDQLIQTLKGHGNSLAGLSVRNEWDWYLDREQLAVDLLCSDDVPHTLDQLQRARIQALFRTDFTRTKGALCWRHQGQTVEVEAALDQGEVRAGTASEPICELELELRQGPDEALLDFAVQVARQVPVLPWDSSKAERGYRLIDADRRPTLPVAGGWNHDAPADRTSIAIGNALLSRALILSERLSLDDAAALGQLLDTLDLLRAYASLTGSLGTVAPLQRLPELDSLYGELRQLDRRLTTERAAAEAFDLISTTRNWGVSMLSLSRRLILWSRSVADVQAHPQTFRAFCAGDKAYKDSDLMTFVEEGAHG